MRLQKLKDVIVSVDEDADADDDEEEFAKLIQFIDDESRGTKHGISQLRLTSYDLQSKRTSRER